jgi:papain like cysteine protease AvrRpt2
VSAAAPGSVLDDRTPLAGAAPAAPPQAAPAGEHELGLAMQPQRETEWCWAAVSVSIAGFFDPDAAWTQCTLVGAQLERTDCCQDAGACNTPQQLTPALARVGHLDKDFGGGLDLQAIAAQVDAGKLVALCIDWSGGGGHFVVIDGYDPSAGMVDVKDPLFGTSYLALSAFPAHYQGGGTWGWTYLTR